MKFLTYVIWVPRNDLKKIGQTITKKFCYNEVKNGLLK